MHSISIFIPLRNSPGRAWQRGEGGRNGPFGQRVPTVGAGQLPAGAVLAGRLYDVRSDRWSIPFAPEYPIEYVYSNDQVHGEWSFQGRPWMTGHTYKATGYDPKLKAVVFVPHEYTYFFEPKSGKWSRTTKRNPYRPDFYDNTVCATPGGAVVWAERRDRNGAGLWRLDAAARPNTARHTRRDR